MMESEKLIMDDSNDNMIYRKQNNDEPCMGGCLDCLGRFFGCCCLFTCCGCCCYPYKTINPGHKGILTRFGQITKILKEGLHYVNPMSEELSVIDVKMHVKKLSNQSILTKDNLPITIDGAVYYNIKNTDDDIITVKTKVFNVNTAVDELAHSTLRFVFGQHTLQEALEKRKEFAQQIRDILEPQATQWGVHIHDIQIIDVVIPKHIQDLLSRTAVAVREGEAEIVMAQARVKSAHMMREAADQLNTPAAMQMRQLETYKTLAESENAKIIFMPSSQPQLDNLTANIVGEALKKI